MTEAWPFAPLTPLSYDFVMADPPWRFGLRSESTGAAKSPQAHYSCMDLADIQALPVGQLCRGDALLWLWATAPMLPHAYQTLVAWGFQYVTAGCWAKLSKTGMSWAFGPGYVLRSAAEFYLIGKVGRPATTKSVRNLVVGKVGRHSQKPDAAYRDAEKLMPWAQRVELFARTRRAGWHAWGDELAGEAA